MRTAHAPPGRLSLRPQVGGLELELRELRDEGRVRVTALCVRLAHSSARDGTNHW